MLLEVISAKYLEGYKVSCTFNDGYTATVDLEATIFNDHRSIFAPLKRQDYFKTFTIRWNTICWDNEADFAPEFLYELAKRQNQAEFEEPYNGEKAVGESVPALALEQV